MAVIVLSQGAAAGVIDGAMPSMRRSSGRRPIIRRGGRSMSLASWSDGPARSAIIDFVRTVTTPDSPGFVPIAARIATFDNDGTLWIEQPLYIQAQFAIARARFLAPQHPEWRHAPPFASILSGDLAALANAGEHDVAALLAATHAGMTTDEFARIASDWFAVARHPRFGRPYRECVYQPMLELLGYLRANHFRTYIVSGGGVDFMRAVSDDLYGIPPAQVVGSSGKTRFTMRNGRAVLVKLSEIGAVDDGPGKPMNIHLHIGQRPIFAFGNSDGDVEMLQYTSTGIGPRLALLLHHDDAPREYAYDRDSKVGRLSRGLDAARSAGWIVVSMKRDWGVVFGGRR
jgi:hypothetical protein